MSALVAQHLSAGNLLLNYYLSRQFDESGAQRLRAEKKNSSCTFAFVQLLDRNRHVFTYICTYVCMHVSYLFLKSHLYNILKTVLTHWTLNNVTVAVTSLLLVETLLARTLSIACQQCEPNVTV